MSSPDKTRRRLLLGLGVAAAAVTTAELVGMERIIGTADGYTARADATTGVGKTLSARQLLVLRDVCEQVIPATDTPGAADVDVHGFIDNQLYHCHSDAQQMAVRDVLDRLDKRAGTDFATLDPEPQLALLEALEGARDGFSKDDRGQFKFLKSLIVFGYFTSEIGATRALRFLPYPGGFKGSLPHDSTTKAWFQQT